MAPVDNKLEVEEERVQAWFMHDWRHGRSWPYFTPCRPPTPQERCYCPLGPQDFNKHKSATEENNGANHHAQVSSLEFQS